MTRRRPVQVTNIVAADMLTPNAVRVKSARCLEFPGSHFAGRLIRRKLAAAALFFIVLVSVLALGAPLIAQYAPTALDVPNQLQSPSLEHPFGTDQLGRDMFSRMLYGARVSLAVGLGSVALGILIGLPLGLAAGYWRGIVDIIVTRVIDVLLAFPGLILAIGIVATVGQDIRSIVLAIGLATAPWIARIVRSESLSLRQRTFVVAARASGATDARILTRHLLPNVVPAVIVQGTLTVSLAILAEASLSFLGIGLRPPTPTWGTELQTGFGLLEIAPYLSLIPGFAIFLLALSFNVLGDALRDLLDPRLRGTV